MRYKVLMLLIAMVVFNGTNNSRELKEFAIVSAIGIDYTEEGNWDVYAQIVESKTTASGASNEEESKITLFEASNKGIQEAIRDLILESSKELYLSHLELILLSESAAKQDLSSTLDFFVRDNESSNTFLVAVSKDCKPDEILQIKAPLEQNPTIGIVGAIESTAIYRGRSVVKAIDECFYDMIGGYDFVLPSLELYDSSEKETSADEKDTASTSQEELTGKSSESSSQEEPKDSSSEGGSQEDSKKKSSEGGSQEESKDSSSEGGSQEESKDSSSEGGSKEDSKNKSSGSDSEEKSSEESSEGDSQESSSGGSSQGMTPGNSSQEKSQGKEESSKKVVTSEIAYFKDRKLAGYIEGDDNIIYNLMINNLKSTVFQMGEKDDKIVIESIKSAVKKKPKFENGEYSVDVNVDIIANLSEVGRNMNISTVDEVKYYEKKINERIKKNIEEYIEDVKNEYNADLLGYKELFHKKLNKEFKKMDEKDFMEYFKNIKSNVNVNTKLSSEGGVIKRW